MENVLKSKLSEILDAEGRNTIIASARELGVAVARFWDALREVEHRTAIAIEPELHFYSVLGSCCRMPPEPSDLGSDADVMALLDEECVLIEG
jgi:hypothetical protein